VSVEVIQIKNLFPNFFPNGINDLFKSILNFEP